MSEDRTDQERNTEYYGQEYFEEGFFGEDLVEDEADQPDAEAAQTEAETPVIDEDFAAKAEARRRRIRKIRLRRKRRTVAAMILAFVVFLTMCSREIVVLKAENRALKKQHAQLEQERDRLTNELSSIGNKEYIKQQARKQLRLLDPGEIMFVFENEKTPAEEEAVPEENAEAAQTENPDEGAAEDSDEYDE